MQTKKQMVINSLNSGDYINALKIAKDFKRDFNKADATIVKRAYEMQHNETFYKQLGFDKNDQYNKAIDILKQTYM